MNIYMDQIEKMVYEQKKIRDNYTHELKSYPQGSISCCKNHGKETFYHSYSEDGQRFRISLNNKPEIMKDLARKEYLSSACNVLDHNIEIIEKASQSLIDYDFDNLKASMPGAYQKIPDEFFFRRGKIWDCIDSVNGAEAAINRHKDWGREPYKMSTYNPSGRKYPTSAGFKVRSKSEQHIVEQLVNYGVPFRYEMVIQFGNLTFAPDLTFRGRDLDLFYWEHAGMMDDDFYRIRHKRKIEQMEKCEIVPWKNLIITYDVNGGINVPLIKNIIENDVIPRL